jgi:hypothetical protein
MLKSIISIIFTMALGAASIFFFYEYNFFVAIILLVWFISRLFGYNLKRLVKGFGEITTHSNLETKCNCAIEFKIIIEEVLKHPTIDRLFNQLQKKTIIVPSTQKEDWIIKMLDNYKKKFGREKLEEVKFNIKNNLVWKNGAIDFNDSIYHEIFIPYEYKDGKEEESKSLFTPAIEIGITIRIFIVNGIIKLQVGDFSKEYTPNGLSTMAYQTHDTITSFPLMYFSYLHKIPENYLNLSSYATESWKNLHVEKKDKKSKGFIEDWKELTKEIRDYNYVCSVADEYVGNRKRWDTIIAGFEKKKSEWLEKENFKNPFARHDDNALYDDLKPTNLYFVNKYLSVFVVNYNEFKEKRERYVYTDYYVERP